MRWIFEELFDALGEQLEDHLDLRRLSVLARHAWSSRERLDLHADAARTEAAIGAFAGAAAARGFRDFSARAARIYGALEPSYIRAPAGSPLSLVRAAGLRGLRSLAGISPFTTLWHALGEHFADVRLRQLFGRYATYCGASPFAAPATLMLVAHVEQQGVWAVEGGMHRIAQVLSSLAAARGAGFHFNAEVSEIRVAGGRARGVTLKSGERIDSDAVVVNADAGALALGLHGLRAARAVSPIPPEARSLSALTWAMEATVGGFPLLRHNVFFSADYAAEFADIFAGHRLPATPTVYVCAQDRRDRAAPPTAEPERLFVLVNAPPLGDTHHFAETEIASCAQSAFALLARCGLTLERRPEATIVTTPSDFARMFPGTGGALYGRVGHGWAASFQRPGARTRLPGLVMAGGGAHPGPGVPMAALSGRFAAAQVLADLASTRRRLPMVTSGGISTR